MKAFVIGSLSRILDINKLAELLAEDDRYDKVYAVMRCSGTTEDARRACYKYILDSDVIYAFKNKEGIYGEDTSFGIELAKKIGLIVFDGDESLIILEESDGDLNGRWALL